MGCAFRVFRFFRGWSRTDGNHERLETQASGVVKIRETSSVFTRDADSLATNAKRLRRF